MIQKIVFCFFILFFLNGQKNQTNQIFLSNENLLHCKVNVHFSGGTMRCGVMEWRHRPGEATPDRVPGPKVVVGHHIDERHKGQHRFQIQIIDVPIASRCSEGHQKGSF